MVMSCCAIGCSIWVLKVTNCKHTKYVTEEIIDEGIFIFLLPWCTEKSNRKYIERLADILANYFQCTLHAQSDFRLCFHFLLITTTYNYNCYACLCLSRIHPPSMWSWHCHKQLRNRNKFTLAVLIAIECSRYSRPFYMLYLYV